MKNSGLASLLLLIVCSAFISCKSTKQAATTVYPITITNPSAIERSDELIILTREQIEQKTGTIEGNNQVTIATEKNEPIVVQYDDLDMDGRWDEAVFLFKFEPNQKVIFNISRSVTQQVKAVVRAHVRMRKKNEDDTFGPLLDSVTIQAATQPTDFSKQKFPPYLTEGPAWENDKVAFRLYLDTRNTKDIYGKTTPKMMMDTVGVNPGESYHNLSRWGMDILAVGKSLGAGSLALSIPNVNGKDTLIRLGGTNISRTTYKKIADGPVRAILQMHYTNWEAIKDAAPVDITEEISIWGGKYFYQSKVTIANASTGAKLVTGIVNLKSKKSYELDAGDCKVLYTYDMQSENKDRLGMAIMVQNNQFAGFGKTPNSGSEILNTYTVSLPVSNQPLIFRFYSGWERSDLLFAHEDSFKKFLVNEAIKYSKRVLISQ